VALAKKSVTIVGCLTAAAADERRGYVPLWFGRPVSQEEQNTWWRRLHKLSPAVFPISCECLVPVDGAIRRGVVNQSDVFGDAA
jgi:hypothetical protein